MRVWCKAMKGIDEERRGQEKRVICIDVWIDVYKKSKRDYFETKGRFECFTPQSTGRSPRKSI